MESPTHPHPENEGHKQEISAVLTVTFATAWGVFDSTGPVFNLGRVFASLTRNIPFCCKIKLLWSHTVATKVTSRLQVPKKQQSILIPKKVCFVA